MIDRPARPRVEVAPKTLQFALFAAACVLPLLVLYLLHKYAVNVPQWDEWAVAILVVKMHQGTLTLHDLWEQHNEHRMLVPYSIMMLLAKPGWNVIRETYFSLVLVVCTQLLTFLLLRKTFRGTALGVAFLFASCCLYVTMQAENWLWGFQIAWFLTGFFVVLLVWLLVAFPLATWSYWLSVLIAFAASFTMSSGLNLWIVGLVLLWLNRKQVGPRKIGLWVILSIVGFAIYLHGWSRGGLQSHPSYAFTHPIEFFGYLFAYFGASFGAWAGIDFSMVLGALVLAGFGFLVFTYVRRPSAGFGDVEIPWIAVGCFSLLCGGMTDIGRVGFGIGQSMAGRYTTYSDFLWVATFALALHAALPYVKKAPVRIAAAALTLLFILCYRNASEAGLQAMRIIHLQDEVSLGVMKTYATASADMLRNAFPDAAALRTFAGDLQRVHDGPFHG